MTIEYAFMLFSFLMLGVSSLLLREAKKHLKRSREILDESGVNFQEAGRILDQAKELRIDAVNIVTTNAVRHEERRLS